MPGSNSTELGKFVVINCLFNGFHRMKIILYFVNISCALDQPTEWLLRLGSLLVKIFYYSVDSLLQEEKPSAFRCSGTISVAIFLCVMRKKLRE